MVFSKEFQQGQIIATLSNATTGDKQYLKIYNYKGIFFVDRNDLFPFLGKAGVLSWQTPTAGYVFSFANGFTAADIDKVATSDQVKIAFGLPLNSDAWSITTNDNSFKTLTGYIEPPVDLSDSSITSLLAYCIQLRNILKANKIAYPALSGFSL